jgi:hypothetical protein
MTIPPGTDERNEGGLEAVLAALQQETFPMEKDALYYAVGDLALTDGTGRIVSVREVLDRVDRGRFLSVEDVADSLRNAMRADEASLPPEAS